MYNPPTNTHQNMKNIITTICLILLSLTTAQGIDLWTIAIAEDAARSAARREMNRYEAQMEKNEIKRETLEVMKSTAAKKAVMWDEFEQYALENENASNEELRKVMGDIRERHEGSREVHMCGGNFNWWVRVLMVCIAISPILIILLKAGKVSDNCPYLE